jgi:hypothetical protein
MAFNSLEIVRKQMLKGYPYWKIKINNKISFENDDNNDIESSFAELQDACNMLDDSFVNIVLSAKTKKEKSEGGSIKDDKEFPIRLKQTSSGSSITGVNDQSFELLKENMQLKNDLNNSQQLLQSLNNRIAQIESQMIQNDDDQDDDDQDSEESSDLMGMIKPYIPALMAKFVGNQVQQKSPTHLAGHPDDDTNTTANQSMNDFEIQKSKAIKAVTKLLKLDNLAGDRLEKLAILAENKPDTYLMAANMLNNM